VFSWNRNWIFIILFSEASPFIRLEVLEVLFKNEKKGTRNKIDFAVFFFKLGLNIYFLQQNYAPWDFLSAIQKLLDTVVLIVARSIDPY
jgi:hypothetical protein